MEHILFAIGATSFTFEGAQARLDRDVSLADLNGGQGIARGKISITDSAGHAATARAASATRTVTVADGYFSPSKLTVKSGTTIRWVWANGLSYTHDVMLDKAPKGVKRFHSAKAATDYTFSRTLTTPGTYRIVCTLHRDMTMTIRVR